MKQFQISSFVLCCASIFALFSAAKMSLPELIAPLTLPIAVTMVLLFFVSRFVEITPWARAVFLLAASSVLGALAGQWLPLSWQGVGGIAMIGTCVCIGLMLCTAGFVEPPSWVGPWLSILVWLYSAGWLGLWLIPQGLIWQTVLAALGVPLILIAVLAWAATVPKHESDPIRASGQLLLLSINLAFCGLVLLA
jgi:hypothetical protein